MEHEDCKGLQDWSSAAFGTRVASEAESTQDLLLFAADTPNTWKVAAVLEELAIPYDFLLVDISADEQKEPKYLQKNPNGRTPTLVDKSQNPPFAVFESGAIILFLADKFPSSLVPDDPLLRSEVIQWIMWQMSALGPMIGQCMYMKRIAAPVADDISKVEFSIRRFEKECDRLLSILETRLEGREYLCGETSGAYSLADVACYGYAASHWWAGLDVSNLPNLQAWLERVGKRRAIKRSVAVPGVSVFGPEGPLFETLRTDGELQKRVESLAERAGRGPLFGWKDLVALFKKADAQGQVPFASHTSFANPGAKPEGQTQFRLWKAAATAAVVLAIASHLRKGKYTR